MASPVAEDAEALRGYVPWLSHSFLIGNLFTPFQVFHRGDDDRRMFRCRYELVARAVILDFLDQFSLAHNCLCNLGRNWKRAAIALQFVVEPVQTRITSGVILNTLLAGAKRLLPSVPPQKEFLPDYGHMVEVNEGVVEVAQKQVGEWGEVSA